MKKYYTSKLSKVMRIAFVQTVIAIIVSTISFAHNNYAQILDKTISIVISDKPFEDGLREIENAAQVKFVYSMDQFKLEQNITLHAVNQPLRKVLFEIFSPRNIKYIVHESESAITLNRLKDKNSNKESFYDNGSNNQDHGKIKTPIQGRVSDGKTGLPMPGVNIIVKGTTVGTTTDAEGKYVLETSPGDKLIFSFIGYASYEFNIGDQTILNVELFEEASNLKEVVINAGYYTTTKSSQTGNIGKVTANDIQKQPVSNPLAALQGRIPGLQIVQQTGVPGGNYQVRIRGQNSIANGNDPLYIIDGVPYISTTMAFAETSQAILFNGTSPLNSINPADIESIEVLKDADATAIYGSRGSNGVILITTKKGTPGKTKLEVNFYTGAGKVASKMELLSSPQYLSMRKEALTNDNNWPVSPAVQPFIPDLFAWDTTRYTDWQKELIGGTATTTDAQLSLSGGDKFTNFSLNGGYHRDGTVFPGDNADQRISTNFTVNNRSANDRFSSTFSTKYVVNTTNLLKRDLTSSALTLPPVAPPLYDEQGNLNWGVNSWNQSLPNPLAYTHTEYESTTKNILMNFTGTYSILSNLNAKVSMGISDIGMSAITTTPKSSLPPTVALTTPNESVFSNSSFKNWNIEPQLNWKPKLPHGKLDILLGTTFLQQVQEGLAQFAYGFAEEALMKNIGAASSMLLATNYYNQYRYHAVFGRINYAWKDRYFLNATGRRDGSSRFGPGKQFANFGALGAAWIFSKENFLVNNLPFLSLGKLRASYGLTGNDQLGNYQYLDTYTSSGPYQGTTGLTPVRLSNPDFAWETNKKIEAGIELGFIDNRLQLSASVYRNRSSNQLVGFTLPPTTGFTSIQGNLPATVQNTGIEIELSSVNWTQSNKSWTTSFNISIPRNELIEFPGLATSPTYANSYVVGEPLTILKRYNYLQVDPTTGIYQFEDVNQDSRINTRDRQTVVFTGQKFFGGIQSSLQLNRFQFDFLFQFVNQQRPNYLSTFPSPPGNPTNQPTWVLNQWTPENNQTDIQKFTMSAEGNNAYNFLRSSTRSVSDASFIRLKNVYVSYSLPVEWCNRLYIQQAKIFLQGQNLLTFTKYLGLDPETGSNYLPPLRLITAGFNLSL